MNTTERDGGDPDFAAYAVRDPETFARNLARAFEQFGKAAAAWVEPRERGEINGDASPFPVMVETLSEIGQYWMSDPARALDAQTRLFTGYLDIWSRSVGRLAGERKPEPTPAAKPDKRFVDEAWNRNLFFDFVKQVYLLTSRWAEELVAEANGVDPETRNRAAFYLRQVTNAASPSNFVLTNPELYRETMAENGANLVRGMKMLAEDVTAGAGVLKLRQSGAQNFKVGENIAASPGAVVAENDLCQIIQYTPTTETVFKRPILISPPWINKFYILDLNPEKSFIGWLVAQGHTVFVISWINPSAAHADKDWHDYVRDGIGFALDTIETATGVRKVNTIGYCVGGTLLATALSYLQSHGDDRIRSATFLTTQVDFTHAGDLKIFVDEKQLAALEQSMAPKGYLDGANMAMAFNLLRSSDLIWPYVVNNYLRGKEPLPFDLLHWNSDATRMPKANHLFYLRNCYLENRLAKGEMHLGETPIDLSNVTVPIYNLAAKEDHIAPAKSVYVGSTLFGSDVTYVVAGSGHIAGVVNPPAKGKYQFWTGPAPNAATGFEAWLADARETKGSWWPHFQDWIAPLAGKRVPAREPGAGDLPVIEPAPGRYVRA